MSRRDNEVTLRDCLTDEEIVAVVVDGVLAGSKVVRRLTKKIRRVERKLRKSADDEMWKQYLKLEELVNERAHREIHIVVRWALTTAAVGACRICQARAASTSER